MGDFMKKCKECEQPVIEDAPSGFCSRDCYRASERARKSRSRKNRQPRDLVCKACDKPFQDFDPRTNACSPNCRAKLRGDVMEDKYGYRNPSQKPRTQEELEIISANKRAAVARRTPEQRQAQESKRQATNLAKFGCVFPHSDETPKRRIKTLKERYGTGSAVRAKIFTEAGFESFEAYAQSVVDFIKANKIPPYSKYVYEKFGITNEGITGILKTTNSLDLISKFKSYAETQIFEFLTQELDIPAADVETNRRPSFMQGLELDIYMPKYNLAIEYHGLAIHSERLVYAKVETEEQLQEHLKKAKTQHEMKYVLCKLNDVKLIQIFEDEWRDKTTLVKEMIRARLGMVDVKIAARKCNLLEIKNFSEFFQANHIAGERHSSKGFGLFHEGELVAALALRVNRTDKYGRCYEISRYATKAGCVVNGGFAKLLKAAKEWTRENGFEAILTYADCRFGSGTVYLKNGFERLGKGDPNYFYERDGIRESRLKHQKRDDLPEATEREQQNSLGWYAIYDAGSEIYRLEV